MKQEIVLEITFCWKCEQCGHKQEPIEHEEWPIHCEKGMKYQPMKQIKIV